MKRTRKGQLFCTAALIGAVGMSQEAGAQTDEAAADTVFVIEEISVTARKRTESVQDVPISLIAVGEQALLKSGAVTLDAVQQLAPGLTISTVGSSFTSYTYIRGAGTNVVDAGADPSVAYFVDEVYQAGAAGLQGDLLDVQRVEVLKGPQGTLFGRNAAAGAISIITNRPSPVTDVWASLEGGNYGQFAARAGATGPLTSNERWLFRIAGAHRQRNAITENPAGRDPGDIDTWNGRGQLQYAGNYLTALLSVDHFRADNGMNSQFITTAIPFGLISPAAAAALPTDESFYRRYSNIDGFERQRTTGVTGRLEWDIGQITLTSVSGYRHNELSRLADQDGTLAESLSIDSEETDESFSQELRLSSDSGRLKWVLGGYYFQVETDRSDFIAVGPDFPIPPFIGLDGDYNLLLDTTSYAAFGQASFDITDELTLTAGGRYTYDRKKATQNTDPIGPAPFFNLFLDPDWDSFDPMVSLEFKPSDRVLLYASFKQGFKSGGFQSLPGSEAIAARAFDPEEVEAYEVGLKSQLFDNRVTFNLALFQTTMNDQQLQRVPSAGVTIIDNAGKTRTRGADFELTLYPLLGLNLSILGTLQEAEFQRYESGGSDFAGNRQLRSPDVSLYFLGEYTLPLGANRGDLSLHTDYSYQSRTFFDAANTRTEGAFQPAYGLLNARIGYTSPSGRWTASVLARNITDKEYLRNILLSGPTGLAVPGDPFTVTVSVGWSLN